MKTAMVAASLTRSAGGLFDSLLGMSRELAKLPDMEVSVAGLQDRWLQADVAAWSPVTMTTFPVRGPRAFGYAPAMKSALVAGAFNLIHMHGLWMYPSAAALAWHRQTRRPYLVSPHGMLDSWAVRNSAWKKRLALAFYEREHLENAACIRALCQSEARAIREFGLKNPICIIPNGVDLPEDGSQKSEVGSQTPGRKVLLYLGRIHAKKGLINLLKAWSEVQSAEGGGQGAEWILAIAGWNQGGHEAELKRIATELRLSFVDAESESGNRRSGESLPTAITHLSSPKPPSVVFFGPQFGEDKAARYRECDAFVLPSLSEGLPMVVLEAWAYGKPVLMTPECNLPEGYAANAAIRIEANPESIARGLETLFQASRSDLQSIGSRGRALVGTRFTWLGIARQMRDVYQWALGGGPKPEGMILD